MTRRYDPTYLNDEQEYGRVMEEEMENRQMSKGQRVFLGVLALILAFLFIGVVVFGFCL